MARKPINWLVEKEDIKEFIKPINIELNIDKNLYRYIFSKEMEKTLIDLEEVILRRILGKIDFNIYEKALLSKISLSYTPDFKNKNWLIRYSPIQIINNIYELAGINIKLDYMDYNNEHEVRKHINEVRSELSGYISYLEGRKELNKPLIEFLMGASAGLEKIMMLKDYDIETSIDKSTYYKNLLLYLASKSLDIYMGTENNKDNNKEENEKTGNFDYFILPKQYYNEVSSKKKAQNPNTIHDGFEGEDINYEKFNKRYLKALRRNPKLVDSTLDLDTVYIMDRLEAITCNSGADKNSNNNADFGNDMDFILRECLESYKKKRIKSKNNKTPSQIMDMLEEKLKFYYGLTHMLNENGEKEVLGTFRGKIDIYGYYGFILKNNYVVLDSFFKLDSDNYIVPSTDDAIYILPIDLFVDLQGNKTKIMNYKKYHEESNIIRRYHNDDYRFKEKVLLALKNEETSVIKSDWFLSIFTPNKEILKK